ncbi:tubulin domain-containing protein [Spinellus fusiger]|nr:tubulin domain-containing protein [Spinellus fusiger]
MREIITLQLGQLANFVGTHYWNTQEAYFYGDTSDVIDHDVLYRAGKTLTGVETFTPRVLIYDLKDEFGSLQKYNALFQTQDSNDVLWNEGINTIVTNTYQKSPYQQELDRMEADPSYTAVDVKAIEQLDTTVKNWSDFNGIYYHPRSMNPIVTHQSESTLTPFDTYNGGRQAYIDNEKETAIFEDNFRFFLEECDQLQGFQLFTGVDNAMGGFAQGLLDDIRDECPKAAILTYGLSDTIRIPSEERARQKQVINRAFAMARLTQLSTIYVPLYTPTSSRMAFSGNHGIRPKYDLMYHTSAVLSSAIETVSLTYRLKKTPTNLIDTMSCLNWRGNTPVAGLSATFPLPILQTGYKDTLALKQPLPMMDLSAPSMNVLNNTTAEDMRLAQSVVVRGLPDVDNHGRNEYVETLFSTFQENQGLLQKHCVDLAYPLSDTYPRFFNPNLNREGFITSHMWEESPKTVPVVTCLSTGSKMHLGMEYHIRALHSIPFNEFFEFSEGSYGFRREDYLEMKEDIITLSDAYRCERDF